MATDQSDQYVLIHHEYAGLAGFEVNDGESSQYEISNQISGYLEDQIVKKLVVKPRPGAGPSPKDPFSPESCSGSPMPFEKKKKFFKPGESISRAIPLALAVRSRQCTEVSGCSDWKPFQDTFRSIFFAVSKNYDNDERSGQHQDGGNVWEFNPLTGSEMKQNFRMRFVPDGGLRVDLDTVYSCNTHCPDGPDEKYFNMLSSDSAGQLNFKGAPEKFLILTGQPMGGGITFPSEKTLPKYVVHFSGNLTDHCVRFGAANKIPDVEDPYIWHENEAIFYSNF
jgi:hypothetical protein